MSYAELVVKEKIQETPDACTLVFENEGGNKVFYKPGQFLTLIFDIDGKEQRRSYSLSSALTMDDEMAVTTKKVEGGLISNHIVNNVKAGDKIKVMLPMGTFTTEFNASKERTVIFLAGGSGITPIMSLIKTFVKKEPESKLKLIYANRDEESIIFSKKFDQLSIEYPEQLQIIHVLEKPSSDWPGFSGLIDADLLTNLINEFTNNNPAKAEYFVCGPEGLMNLGLETISSLGVSKEMTHKESFLSAIAQTQEVDAAPQNDGGNAAEATVTVKYMGDVHEFKVPKEGKSILFTALENGIDLPFSCQSGLCTACMGKCTSGKVNMEEADALTDKEIQEGYVLTCVGHPGTDNVTIEIE